MTMNVKNLKPLSAVLNPTMKYTTGAKMIEQNVCRMYRKHKNVLGVV